ncbi:MAG: hypothetical protein R2758_00980 [Bacteroidales bacterium]
MLVKGRVQGRYFNPDELELKIREIHLLTAVRDDLVNSITIKLKAEMINPEFIKNSQIGYFREPGEQIAQIPVDRP